MNEFRWLDASENHDRRSVPARTVETSTALSILHAISHETDPERLNGTVIRLALEHAGAELGLLIRSMGDAFRIEAEAVASADGVRVIPRQSAISADELPESLFHHVLRTKEPVLLNDVSRAGAFLEDEYFRRHGPRSALCMPLLKESELVGLIYLHNKLVSGVFTHTRTAVLELLGCVAAISLENARLNHDLRMREAKVRRLVDSNIIGILTWHADGRVLDINEALRRTVGYSREELLSGRVRWTDWIPVEWHQDVAEALVKLREAGTDEAHVQEYIRKDGTRVPVLAAAAAFDETANEGMAFALDLTQHEWAGRALSATARESRLIIDALPGLVGLLTPTGEVEVVNRQLLEYFGQTLEELRQWGTNGTVYPDDLPHVVEVFTQSIEAGTPYNILQRFRRADGVYRWFENRGFPLRDEAGRIVRWCVLLQDIEERKRAEDALRESERELRLIVDSIPGMVATFTPSGELEFVNRQVLDYFGKPFEELKQWRIDDTLHPEEKMRVAEIFARAMVSGVPFEFESRARHRDGVYRWHESRGFPLRGTDGRIVRWYNLIIDIDERKRAEEALAGSERKLKVTIDTIPALAWSTDPDGGADFFNQHYLDFVGLTAEQASGWGWTAALHPDDLNDLAAKWQRILVSGDTGEAEARLRRHDGEYRWFLFRANPLRDETGRIVKWFGVNTDIEDRKQAEAELRRAYDSFADAQRLSKTGSFITDLVGDDHNWSEETYRIFEFDPATTVTVQKIRDIIHPDDLPPFDAMIARAMSGVDVAFSFRIVTARAGVKHVRGIAHVIEKVEGRPMFVGALQDVTESALAEEALSKARSELAHVARVTTLSTLTASIAHEVNQPLSGIVTNAGTCLRMLDADPPNIDGARETAKRTMRDGHRASEVIMRLRALFSNKEFTLEPLDLNAAAQEVISLSLSELQRHRVVLRSELADDLPNVIGDRIQLQQVILNLLRNATEAMIDVHDRPRQLLIRTELEDEHSVRLTVRDAGVGLDARTMGKLFEAFYTTKSEGMGIGLSVSRSIIERHHGRLWAKPNDGPGSTFAFSIPCHLPSVI